MNKNKKIYIYIQIKNAHRVEQEYKYKRKDGDKIIFIQIFFPCDLFDIFLFDLSRYLYGR